MTRIAGAGSQSSLLARREFNSQGLSLSQQQLEMDAMQTNFRHEASDVGNLLSMTAAAGVFRITRLGMQSLGLARSLANPIALGFETTAFRGMTNFTSQLRGITPHETVLDARGWMTSYLSLGSLKLAGHLSQGQNVFFGHSFQSSAMVASHNLANGLGIATAPQGTILEQLLHAEVTNLAMGAGQGVLHLASGGVFVRAERVLDTRSEALAQSRHNRRAHHLQPSPLMAMRSAELQRVATDRPPSISEVWFRDNFGTKLWSAEPVKTNRDSVRAITRGVLQLLGKQNVVAQFGYGSGFDKFDPEASVRQRDPDNKFDLVIIVNSFEASLRHLATHWGFDAQKTAELITLAKRGGVFCPNPDMLAEGFGLLGFKLTIVSEERFYADNNHGKPALNFAQFRLKDTIIADESNPSNRLLWIQDAQNTPRFQRRIDEIRDHMLDIAFHLRGSFAPHFFRRSRYNANEVSMGDLTGWMYELSYNVEAYRPFDWGKGPKLFTKRAAEITPFMLEAARRFAMRNATAVRLTHNGLEITPEQITVENLYQVKFVDRDAAAKRNRQTVTPAYTQLLIDTNKANWIGSKAAMGSLRYAESYEYISNAIYGGRKMRKYANEKGPLARFFLRPVVRILKRIIPDKIDSVNYPVLFTDIAIQINGLYRAGKINDAEWEILNRAWMANPLMTRQRDIEILESFEKNIPRSPAGNQAYRKFLDAVAETPFREPQVVRWSKRRMKQLIEGVSNPVSLKVNDFNLSELTSYEREAVFSWLSTYSHLRDRQLVQKMLEDLSLPRAHLHDALWKLLNATAERVDIDPELIAMIRQRQSEDQE